MSERKIDYQQKQQQVYGSEEYVPSESEEDDQIIEEDDEIEEEEEDNDDDDYHDDYEEEEQQQFLNEKIKEKHDKSLYLPPEEVFNNFYKETISTSTPTTIETHLQHQQQNRKRKNRSNSINDLNNDNDNDNEKKKKKNKKNENIKFYLTRRKREEKEKNKKKNKKNKNVKFYLTRKKRKERREEKEKENEEKKKNENVKFYLSRKRKERSEEKEKEKEKEQLPNRPKRTKTEFNYSKFDHQGKMYLEKLNIYQCICCGAWKFGWESVSFCCGLNLAETIVKNYNKNIIKKRFSKNKRYVEYHYIKYVKKGYTGKKLDDILKPEYLKYLKEIDKIKKDEDKIDINELRKVANKFVAPLKALPEEMIQLIVDPLFQEECRRINSKLCFSTLCFGPSIKDKGQGEIWMPPPTAIRVHGWIYHIAFDMKTERNYNGSPNFYIFDPADHLTIKKKKKRRGKLVLDDSKTEKVTSLLKKAYEIVQKYNPLAKTFKNVSNLIKNDQSKVKNIAIEVGFDGKAGELCSIENYSDGNQRSFWYSIVFKPDTKGKAFPIHVKNRAFEPLQHVLLFPYGGVMKQMDGKDIRLGGWFDESRNSDHDSTRKFHSFNGKRILSLLDYTKHRIISDPRFTLMGKLSNQYAIEQWQRSDSINMDFLASEYFQNTVYKSVYRPLEDTEEIAVLNW